MVVEFSVLLPCMKTYWLYTVPELMVSAIDNLKMVAGGHDVHERQAVL